MTTVYKVAESGADYKRVHGLIKAEGVENADKLSFPTIMAMDDESGECVGCLGTNTEQGMIIAGPLVIKRDRRRTHTIIRLVEAYEAVMRHCKIKSFIFSAKADDEQWLRYIDEVLGFTPYYKDDAYAWFVWKLKE